MVIAEGSKVLFVGKDGAQGCSKYNMSEHGGELARAKCRHMVGNESNNAKTPTL